MRASYPVTDEAHGQLSEVHPIIQTLYQSANTSIYACPWPQAGRYELRLLQQAERQAGEAAEMVAKATAETEAALVERLDQRSKQVADDNRRLEGYLRMRSKVMRDPERACCHGSHACLRVS